MITFLRVLHYSNGPRAYLTAAQVRRMRKKARREVAYLRPDASPELTALAVPIATAKTPAELQWGLDQICLHHSELAANLVTGVGQAMS